jgi:hypothetical protein
MEHPSIPAFLVDCDQKRAGARAHAPINITGLLAPLKGGHGPDDFKLTSWRYLAQPQQKLVPRALRKLKIALGLMVYEGSRPFGSPMIEVTSDDRKPAGMGLIGAQPIALAAGALILILLGVGAIGLWRAYTGASPEQDRIIAARQLQVRAAQASEQLVEKTKGLEATQQESIDQLQLVQEQLQTAKRLLAAHLTDNKRLSEQVSGLTEAINGLRQSFASAPAPEASRPSASRSKSVRSRHYASRGGHRRPAKFRNLGCTRFC